MTDRIPGSSWSNPIWHRGKWRIYAECCGPLHTRYAYVHDSYDGPGDNRSGYTVTVEDAKAEIDEYEADQ